MKKISKLFALTLSMMIASSSFVLAETTQFTPLNFNDSSAIRTSGSTTSTAAVATDTKGPVMLDPAQVTGGTKMQNAILQLDNAQIEVRNQLLNYRTNYTEIDSKYKSTISERKAAKKKIKQAEKRIKNLEKAKTKIRKNFEQKINM